jgi:hypothetical protein
MTLDSESGGTQGAKQWKSRGDADLDHLDAINAGACGHDILRRTASQCIGKHIARPRLGDAQSRSSQCAGAGAFGRCRCQGGAHVQGQGHLEDRKSYEEEQRRHEGELHDGAPAVLTQA